VTRGVRGEKMSERIRNPEEFDPAEEEAEPEAGTFAFLSVGEFYDLLMEQQEQM